MIYHLVFKVARRKENLFSFLLATCPSSFRILVTKSRTTARTHAGAGPRMPTRHRSHGRPKPRPAAAAAAARGRDAPEEGRADWGEGLCAPLGVHFLVVFGGHLGEHPVDHLRSALGGGEGLRRGRAGLGGGGLGGVPLPVEQHLPRVDGGGGELPHLPRAIVLVPRHGLQLLQPRQLLAHVPVLEVLEGDGQPLHEREDLEDGEQLPGVLGHGDPPPQRPQAPSLQEGANHCGLVQLLHDPRDEHGLGPRLVRVEQLHEARHLARILQLRRAGEDDGELRLEVHRLLLLRLGLCRHGGRRSDGCRLLGLLDSHSFHRQCRHL
mmetsp:Transcript_42336/g.135559  ORF Transcript_42336/g.135559 Transcript_42336/m.135559 type:complete len:323 (-) Transcript_42336:1321-2289(-)